jgi:hypothetical protein
MSATFAAVPVTLCTSPDCASTPMGAFIPKDHGWPFLVWGISGSRSLLAFLVFGRRVVASGTASTLRSIPAKERIA